MDRLPIFSSYSQGENRVSSSILAVLARIELRLVEELLLRMAGGDPIELVSIRPQFTKKGAADSVPDGGIIASAQVLFEFKVRPGEVRASQLRGHCKHFHRPDAHPCWLIVVTPDHTQPLAVDEVDAELSGNGAVPAAKIRWCSYGALSDAIDEMLDESSEEVAERDRFLLREVQTLIANEGLVATDETVVVAARTAWKEYEAQQVYVCQADRSFRAATHLGFYTDGQIKPVVPEILGWYDIEVGAHGVVSIIGDEADVSDEAIERLGQLCAGGGRAPGFYRAAVLTTPDDERTIHLDHGITNDQQDKNGRKVAWTMGQRYVPTERITAKPTVTLTSALSAKG